MNAIQEIRKENQLSLETEAWEHAVQVIYNGETYSMFNNLWFAWGQFKTVSNREVYVGVEFLTGDTFEYSIRFDDGSGFFQTRDRELAKTYLFQCTLNG